MSAANYCSLPVCVPETAMPNQTPSPVAHRHPFLPRLNPAVIPLPGMMKWCWAERLMRRGSSLAGHRATIGSWLGWDAWVVTQTRVDDWRDASNTSAACSHGGPAVRVAYRARHWACAIDILGVIGGGGICGPGESGGLPEPTALVSTAAAGWYGIHYIAHTRYTVVATSAFTRRCGAP